jgi:phosphate transport system permease protein
VSATTGSPLGNLSGNARRHRRERLVRRVFLGAAALGIVISAAIVLSLIGNAIGFVTGLENPMELLTGSGWFPRRARFDIKTPLVGSIVISVISLLVAGPIGLGAAVYLSEYARPRVRRVVKPILEILAGVPSVVLGFFALTFITPELVGRVFATAGPFNYLSAGIAVGFLTTPLMASVTEDALRSVPHELREASYGLGARKRTTVTKVVLPAAVSGIVAALILTISRAIGETMVVTIAAGGSGGAPFAWVPTDGGITLPSAIANLATGSDRVVASGGNAIDSLYFVGVVLFAFTLGLNIIGNRVVRKHRKVY